MSVIAVEKCWNTNRDRIEEKVENPSIVVIVSRIVYALMAYVSTFYGGQLIGLDVEPAKEVAVLNARVAYYTHEAAGKVVTAINVLYQKGKRSD